MKLPKPLQRVAAVAADAYKGWNAHKAPRMGGALSYYAAFSMGPLILIGIALAGIFFGREAANGQIFDELKGLLGAEAAAGIQAVVKGSATHSKSLVATILGVVSLLLGASGVFAELHDALNTIWGVKLKENQGIWAVIKDRFLSISMVLGTGFLLLVSLLLSAGLAFVGNWLSSTLPGGEALWQIINFFISLAVISLLFTGLFKYVPDVKIRWRESLLAGLFTAVLFEIGKFGLEMYIGKAGVASAYGAAGSIIVLLLWAFYSAQILYFGAELSRALAHAFGTEVKPRRIAEAVLT